MAKVLLRVKRSNSWEFFVDGTRNHPRVVLTRAVERDDNEDYRRVGEFFEVEERDVEVVMRILAEMNPGCEVQAHTLSSTGTCPAAEYVLKKVSKDGVLPS